MAGKRRAAFLLGLAVALIGAWNLEAWMIGRDLISTYVAPLGLGVLAASFLLTPYGRPGGTRPPPS